MIQNILPLLKKSYVLIIVVLFLILILVTPVVQNLLNTIFRAPEQYAHTRLVEVRNTVLIAFSTVQVLDATLSVLSASTLNIFVGDIAVGSTLDPLNAVLEKTSTVLLISLLSIELQLIALKIAPHFSGTLMLAAIGGFLLLASVFRRLQPPNLPGRSYYSVFKKISLMLVVFMCILRLCIPIVVFVEETIISIIVDDRQNAALQAIEHESNASDIKDTGIKSFFQNSIQSISQRFEMVQRQLVDMIIIFLIRTIFTPLLVLLMIWVLYLGIRARLMHR